MNGRGQRTILPAFQRGQISNIYSSFSLNFFERQPLVFSGLAQYVTDLVHQGVDRSFRPATIWPLPVSGIRRVSGLCFQVCFDGLKVINYLKVVNGLNDFRAIGGTIVNGQIEFHNPLHALTTTPDDAPNEQDTLGGSASSPSSTTHL